MENSKGHGKVTENDDMSWNFYYCTEQFCKSDRTSFIKSNYEPFYLFNNGMVLRADGTVYKFWYAFIYVVPIGHGFFFCRGKVMENQC